jgi:hypothetical protein
MNSILQEIELWILSHKRFPSTTSADSSERKMASRLYNTFKNRISYLRNFASKEVKNIPGISVNLDDPQSVSDWIVENRRLPKQGASDPYEAHIANNIFEKWKKHYFIRNMMSEDARSVLNIGEPNSFVEPTLEAVKEWLIINRRWPQPQDVINDVIKKLGGRKAVYQLLPQNLKDEPMLKFWIAPIDVLNDWMIANQRWPKYRTDDLLETKMANWLWLKGNSRKKVISQLSPGLQEKPWVKFYIDPETAVLEFLTSEGAWPSSRSINETERIIYAHLMKHFPGMSAFEIIGRLQDDDCAQKLVGRSALLDSQIDTGFEP